MTTDIDYLEVDAGGNNLNTLSSARNNFVSFPLTTFNQISDRLNNIKILVWNFGPKGRLNENDANTIDSLFLSGIGIVMNGSGALPTLKIENPNHSFFSTFGIDWSDNNQIELESFGLTGVPDDPITSTFNAPGLSFAKNGYLMQSVNIINTETAFPIIKMIENNKVISARIIGDVAKSVYLGFNIDIIEDINLKENLIKKIIDWIEGTVDVEETTQTPGEVNLSVINNDKEGTIIVNIEEFRKTIPIAEILIVDITGSCIKKLYSGQSNNRKTSYQFNINEFANGFYLVVLKYNNTVKSVPFINFK